MKTAIIIMCAGKGTRWNRATPKQLEPINSVPNIDRTISMIPNTHDVFVSVNIDNKSFFSNYNLIIGSSEREIDRFRNGFALFDKYDRIIYLYGDVVYNQNDLDVILSGGNNYIFLVG